MIGGTSGSETKLCQPAASQSKRTQTRSSSLGSRKTVAPSDPCCFRFSAPVVEKTFKNWSKSSTVVVARNIPVPLSGGLAALLRQKKGGQDARGCAHPIGLRGGQ